MGGYTKRYPKNISAMIDTGSTLVFLPKDIIACSPGPGNPHRLHRPSILEEADRSATIILPFSLIHTGEYVYRFRIGLYFWVPDNSFQRFFL